MLVLHDPLRQTDLPRGCVATIGNFDGMHIGHQAIIGGVVARARETGRPSAVITFHPHPLTIVAPDRVPKQILTLSQKEELIRAMGVDAMLVVPFTHEFSRWTADRFIEEFLVSALQVTEVRIGRDFAFGAGREGHLEKLQEAGKRFGFDVHGVDEVRIRGIRVSSSRIRRGIARGAMRTVALALGRTYFIDGLVATGRRLGRKIGFPTVYGDTVRLYFHALLRREQQFRSAVELTRQIRDDIERSRRYFRRHPIQTGDRGQGAGRR
jgi:riboflavin kinase/FMN adenylyltransferase